MKSYNPATGDIIWEGEAANEASVDRAVHLARNAFPTWARRPFTERLAIVENFRDLIEANKEDLAEAIAKETGKPLWDSASEVGAMMGKVAISVKAYEERTGSKIVDMAGNVQAHLSHKPHGVLAVFGPYNFPAHLPNGHIVPALLAGNVILFKPSDYTPLVGEIMAQLWKQAGLPDGVFGLLQGQKETGIALAGHPGIDGLLFTGSSDTGKILHKQYGGQPHKIMALEMGGNNPLIVWEPLDVKAAAYHTVLSSFISSGQRCTCARRLIIDNKPQADDFLEQLIAMARKLTVGSYTDKPEPFMGPLVDNVMAESVLEGQEKLLSNGGTALLQMHRKQPDKPFLTAGIIDVTNVSHPADTEYFGPLLQVIRVDSFDHAIKQANNTAYGLASAIFTQHRELYDRFHLESRAGLVNWNRQTTGASSALPFGGTGISGNHRPAAFYAADYCAYPVSSLESETLTIPSVLTPGIAL